MDDRATRINQAADAACAQVYAERHAAKVAAAYDEVTADDYDEATTRVLGRWTDSLVRVPNSIGIDAPFEFVCLSCSSQGVRMIIPPGGFCSRCAKATYGADRVPTVFPPARPEREPVGCYCLGGPGGMIVWVHGARPSWLVRWVRRMLMGDVYMDRPS